MSQVQENTEDDTTKTPENTPQEDRSYKNFPLETRDFVYEKEPCQFDFLIIDRPEKWEEANLYTHKFSFRPRGGRKALNMNLLGLSFGEWESIEFTFTLPDAPDNIDNLLPEAKKVYEDQVTDILEHRKIRCIEISTGKKIPGETFEEKTVYMKQAGIGELEAVHDYIIDYCSAVDPGQELALHQHINSKSPASENIDFNTFDDWLTLSGAGLTHHWQRPFQQFILEFPLKKITQDEFNAIEEKHKAPNPPERPGRNPATGKIDPRFPIRALTDKKWLKASREADRRKLVALLDAMLLFEIPGKDEKEKIYWLEKRLLGDVLSLRQFINLELKNYRTRFDFFTGS